MESTAQKTFTQLMTLLSVATVLVFNLLICPALSAVSQCKVFRVTDGDTIGTLDNGKSRIIRLVGIDDHETSKKMNLIGQPLCQNYIKNLADLVLIMSVEKSCYGDDRYSRFLGVVFKDRKNVNLEMVRAGLVRV